MMNGMMGGTMMLWGLVALLLLLGLIVAIIYAITRASERGSTSGDSAHSAEPSSEILKRRLAQGEITPEQYEELRQKVN